MKEILELLISKKRILKKFKKIELKKRVLFCFSGVDENSFYNLVFLSKAKSRFLQSHAKELVLLAKDLGEKDGVKYKKKLFFHTNALCSKAKALLKEEGFLVYAAV